MAVAALEEEEGEEVTSCYFSLYRCIIEVSEQTSRHTY